MNNKFQENEITELKKFTSELKEAIVSIRNFRKTVKRNISKLKEKEIIERIGVDKNGYLKII